jgi:ribosomal-protein-alanine N-acetyltransferase
MEIHTPRLALVSATVPQLEQLQAGVDAFERANGFKVAPGYTEYPEALATSLKWMAEHPGEEWFAPLLFIHRSPRVLMGLGGFKGPPDEHGSIELGYGIAPAYRRQGFATEATLAMLQHLCQSAKVAKAVAHTLPELNASTRVLAKAGFRLAGESVDPDAGRVWRWEILIDLLHIPATDRM